MNSPHVSALSDPFLFFFRLLVHILWGVDNPRTVPSVLCCMYVGHVSIMNPPHVSALSDPFLFFFRLLEHISWGVDNPRTVAFVLCCMYVVRKLTSATPFAYTLCSVQFVEGPTPTRTSGSFKSAVRR